MTDGADVTPQQARIASKIATIRAVLLARHVAGGSREGR